MKSRSARSRFDGLSDMEKTNVRQAAVTKAQQGLSWGRSASNENRAPGNQQGTYNGPGEGSTASNTGGGVELLGRVVFEQTRTPAPKPVSTQKAPAWPKAKPMQAAKL